MCTSVLLLFLQVIYGEQIFEKEIYIIVISIEIKKFSQKLWRWNKISEILEKKTVSSEAS